MTIGIEETEAGRALPLFRRECIVSCERITSPSTRPATAQQDVLNPLSLSLFILSSKDIIAVVFPFFFSSLFIRIEMARRCRKSVVVNNSKVKATMRNGSKFNNWTTPSSPSWLLFRLGHEYNSWISKRQQDGASCIMQTTLMMIINSAHGFIVRVWAWCPFSKTDHTKMTNLITKFAYSNGRVSPCPRFQWCRQRLAVHSVCRKRSRSSGWIGLRRGEKPPASRPYPLRKWLLNNTQSTHGIENDRII